jgi:hypothetical protein
MSAKKIVPPVVLTKDDLIEKYSHHCLIHGAPPATVYKFAVDNGFEEADFYQFFASFEALERFYFAEMFNHTLQTLQQSPSYTEFGGVDKLSAFYFTFFELATANRSFVLYTIGNGYNVRTLVKLKELRTLFTAFAQQALDKPLNIPNERADKLQEKALREAAWVQFLTIFRFWIKDTSPGFEKTDIFIEKSVKASADLVYNSPLQSLVDLGKFVWKEKFTV